MGRIKKENSEKLERLMSSGETFILSESQYREKIEHDFPKDKSYLLRNSFVSRMAERNGFRIRLREPGETITEREIIFERIDT